MTAIDPNAVRFLDFAALCWVRDDQIRVFAYATLRPDWLIFLHRQAVSYGNNELALISGAWMLRRGLCTN